MTKYCWISLYAWIRLEYVQDGDFMKMFNVVLWIYLGAWISQGSAVATDTQSSQYAWVCSYMSEYVWDKT